jgi:hypothetical protein
VTNSFYPGKSIAANDSVDIQVPQMKAGDFIQGLASATGLNIQAISGAYFS